MKIEICGNKILLIVQNGSDQEALTTNIQDILNSSPELVRCMRGLSHRNREIIWNSLWRVYCAGTSDGRLARQIEIDSRSYTT